MRSDGSRIAVSVFCRVKAWPEWYVDVDGRLSPGDQLGKERGACLRIARLFAVIFLCQREAHAPDMPVSFLGGQLCMEQGACLRSVMLLALPCDLALVSFVCRVFFGTGRDSLTIQICTKKQDFTSNLHCPNPNPSNLHP